MPHPEPPAPTREPTRMRGRRLPMSQRFTLDDPRVQTIPESGCWVWMGYLEGSGYGRVMHRGRDTLAHREAWSSRNGPIPPGMMIDHLCRVRCCVNPDHLRIVTPRQNTVENSTSRPAINAAKRACPRCGGAYKTDARGHRKCVPCDNADSPRRYRLRKNRLAATRPPAPPPEGA